MPHAPSTKAHLPDWPMTEAEFQSVPHAPYMGAQKSKKCRCCKRMLPSSSKPIAIGETRELRCTKCGNKLC